MTRAGTLLVQAAALAVFLARPTVPQTAAIGFAALVLLLAIDSPTLRGRVRLLVAAAVLTATTMLAASVQLSWFAPLAPLALAVTIFLATPAKPGKRSGSSVKYEMPSGRHNGSVTTPGSTSS